MAINTYRFWMATDSNRLLANQTSFIQASAPSFYQGNVANLELYMVISAGVGVTPIDVPFPAGAEISVAVGDTNAYPTGGSWELSVDEAETAPMPYNATTTQVAATLNALSSVTAAGGVSVSKTGEGYTITWNTYGLKPTISIGSDTLTPSSYQSISLVQAGNANHRQIVFVELRQNPIALSTTWTPLPAPSITSSLVKAWDGSSVIWRVTIYPQPKAGTMTLSYGTKTATIDVASDTTTIANALDAQVFSTGQYQWDIVLDENTALLASGNLIGYNGYSGTINFATAECHQFLAGAEGKNTTIEVSISVDDKRYTLIQTGCNIFADVISDGVITPLPLGVALSEQVANARFVRRDIDQNPDSATQDVIWQNLGVETLGSDIVGALNGADSPSAANPLVTASDLSGFGAVWGNIDGTLSDQTDLQSALNDKYDASNPDGFIDSSALTGYATESWVTSQGYLTSAILDGYAELSGATFTGGVNFTWTLGFQDNGHLDASGVDADGRFRIRFGAFATGASFVAWGDFGFNGTYLVYGNGSNMPETVASQTWVNAGVTFSGKTNFTSVGGAAGLNIGIGGTPANATVNGDIWIPTAGTNLNFRDGNGIARVCASTTSGNTFNQPQAVDTSNTLAALRVTQRGTGNAIEVEDSTSPDTTRFVVDQFGKVGVGTAPDATAAIRVDANGISFNGLSFNPTGTASHTGGSQTLDLLVTINGVNYRLGLRPA
jgi:hypothetical protein